MPINPNIALAYKGIELENPLNRLAQFSQIQSAQNQNALAQYQLAAAQRAEEQQNAFYQRAGQPGFKLDVSTALPFGKTGLEFLKAQREAENAGLQAEELRGKIAAQPLARKKTQAEIDAAELKRRSDIVENISGAFVPLAAASAQGTPVSLGQVQQTAQSLLRRGLIGQTEIDELPQSDADVPEFLKNLVLGSDKARTAFVAAMPKIERVDTGANITPVQGNPLLSGYGQTMTNVPVIPKTAAPAGPSSLAVMQAEVAALPVGDPRRVELQKAIDKQTQSPLHYVSSEQGVMAVDPTTNKVTPVIVNGKPLLDTSTTLGRKQLDVANARLKISRDTERRLQEEADSSGGLSPQALDIAAQMVLQSGVMPPLGSGKKASEARVQVMNRVAEMTGTDAAAGASNIIGNQQNTLAAKAALKDFTSGISARKITSNNTAINHLQTMYELANDLNNKDIRIVNAAGNAFATATGQPAPTNFNAAKQLVAAEVIKAVVNNGGGVTERQEAAESFARANSPEQLKGVINTYRVLLGGQLESLEGQYKAGTGRDDFRSKFLTPNTQKVLPAVPAAAKTSSDIPQAAIDFLKQGRGTREQFDAQFGAGSAKKVLGN
jgi:hypothetical protein